MGAYFEWAAAQGIEAPKLRLAEWDGLRGVAAASAIGEGEVVVQVPRDMALVVVPRMRCPFPELVAPEYWSKCEWYVRMALLLVHERRQGASSRVVGYMRHLPQEFDLPLTWSEEEVAQTHYPAMVEEVQRQRQRWREIHSRLAAAVPAGQSIPYEEFVWALQAVRSRCFSGPYSGSPLKDRIKVALPVLAAATAYITTQHIPLEQALNGGIAAVLFNILYDLFLSQKLKWYAMCPVIDSMNHSSASSNEVAYEYFRDAFSVTHEQQGPAPGQQVFISYGPQTNDSLMQYYGFVEEDNPHDVYALTALADKLAATQQQGLGSGAAADGEGGSAPPRGSGGGPVPSASRVAEVRAHPVLGSVLDRAPLTTKGADPRVMQVVRFLLSDAPLEACAAKQPAPAELRALRALHDLAEQEQRASPTDAAADEALLRSKGAGAKAAAELLSGRQRLTLEFRVAKKRVLAAAAAELRKRAAKLGRKMQAGAS